MSTKLWFAFADNKNLIDEINGLTLNFVRSTVATYYDAGGTLRTAATDEPRFDHDPDTGQSLGLLIEEARTNLFLNSLAPVTQSIAVNNGTVYTASMRGAGSVTLADAGVGTVTQGNPVTFTAGSTNLDCTVAGGVDWVQVEAGPFATSVIPTAGTSAFRDDDDCGTPDVSWFNQGGPGTFYWAGDYLNPLSNQRLWSVGFGGSANDTIEVLIVSGGSSYRGSMFVSAVQELVSDGGSVIAGLNKHALAYAINDGRGAANGTLTAPDTAVANIISNVDNLKLGRRINQSFWVNAHIAEFGYKNIRSDDEFLEAVTRGDIPFYGPDGLAFSRDIPRDIMRDITRNIIN